jgi:hypothetical protein
MLTHNLNIVACVHADKMLVGFLLGWISQRDLHAARRWTMIE